MNPQSPSPLALDQVVGHSQILQRLTHALEQNRLPSAYLFCGLEGVGKQTLARALAKAINCENGTGKDDCPSCLMFQSGEHPDFIEIIKDGRFIKIGQIQGMLRELALRPAYAKTRVVLVAGAETMNLEAANCFLKMLEEPPLDTLLILTAPAPGLLAETLVSRCQRVDFSPLSDEELKILLDRDFTLSGSEAKLVMDFGSGRIRPLMIEKAGLLIEVRDKACQMLNELGRQHFMAHSRYFETLIKQETHLFFLEFLAAWLFDQTLIKQGGQGLYLRSHFQEQTANLSDWSHKQLMDGFDLVIETEKAIHTFAARQLALEGLALQLAKLKRL